MSEEEPKRNNRNKSNSIHLGESTIKTKTDDEDGGIKTWNTAIQILLPVAALAILWGRRGFFARFFLQFDKNCVSVFCPSFSKRERLLKWASGRLQPTWSSSQTGSSHLKGGPAEFWTDGSLLCTLINSAIPGACPNPHRHWQKPPSHGQALAYKYLGVVPMFAELELNNRTLTPQQEQVLLGYLVQVQQAISKISEQDLKFSSRYVAKGMGLVAGEQNRKTSFYIYSNSCSSTNKHDVMVSIRGPYNNHSVVTIPACYVSRKTYQQSVYERKRLSYESKAQKSFFRSLSIDFGSFISVHQKDDSAIDIPVKLFPEKDRVKVVFIPKTTGIHEISIITNGCHLLGSPFTSSVTENSSGIAEDFEEEGETPLFKKGRVRNIRRRIISKIIDFVDEQISYDKLNIKPVRSRTVPEIKITRSRDEGGECELEKSLSSVDSGENDVKVLSKIESEAIDGGVSNESELNNNEIGPKSETKLEVHPLDLEIEAALTASVQQILNSAQEVLSLHGNSELDFDASKPEIQSKSSVDDEFPIANTHETSPVYQAHTDKVEVSERTSVCNGSSSVLNKNSKRKWLQKQKSFDIPDEELPHKYFASVINEELAEKLKQTNLKVPLSTQFSQNSNESESLRDYEILVQELNEAESDFPAPESLQNDRQTIDEEQNRNVDEEFEKLFESQWQTEEGDEEENHEVEQAEEAHETTSEGSFEVINESEPNDEKNQSPSEQPKKNQFPELNQMNILSFLSSLKSEDATDVTAKTEASAKTETVVSYRSKDEQCELNNVNVKERLRYWESHTNLNAPQKWPKPRFRHSLPTLLPTQFDADQFYNSQPEIYNDCGLRNLENGLEFKSLFKERQAYWKRMSSQTLSCSSINNGSLYFLENIASFSSRNDKSKARRSLPDLFSKTMREEVFTQIMHDNANFPVDFFNSPDVLKFKTKFKECRDYWEKLSSTQNLNYPSCYFTDTGSYYLDANSEENLDSGFCSSLPNLWAKNSTEHLLTEDPDSLKFRDQYKQRQEYWERLSSRSVHAEKIVKHDKSHYRIPGVRSKLKLETEYQMRIKENSRIVEDETEDSSVLSSSMYSELSDVNETKTEGDTNLTDDLKSVNDQKYKISDQYNQARNFFKSLEGSTELK